MIYEKKLSGHKLCGPSGGRSPGRLVGFTLVELMVVVAIISLLATLAYPSYRRFTAQAEQEVGKGYLLEFSIAMERYRGRVGTYVGVAEGGASGPPRADIFPAEVPPGEAPNYRLQILEADGDYYRLQAVPLPGTAPGTISLDSTGRLEGP